MLVAGARNQSCGAREPTMGAAEGNGTGRMHGGRAAAATFIIAPCSTGAMQEAAAKRHVIFLGCCSGQQRTHTLCSRHLAITMRALIAQKSPAPPRQKQTNCCMRPNAFK